MSSDCRCFRTSLMGRFDKLLIAHDCVAVSKGRQVCRKASHRNNKQLWRNLDAASGCCFEITNKNCLRLFQVELFRCFHRVGNDQAYEAVRIRSGWLTGRVIVKTTFDIAHCRTFETLHRLCFLSYTGRRDCAGLQRAMTCAAVQSGQGWCSWCDRGRADCDRVNGTVGSRRPLLHIAQMVGWCALGPLASQQWISVTEAIGNAAEKFRSP